MRLNDPQATVGREGIVKKNSKIFMAFGVASVLVIAVLVVGLLTFFWQEKPSAELAMNFAVNDGVPGKEPEISLLEAPGVEMVAIEPAELRNLKEELERAAGGDGWVGLNDYDLPESLFAASDDSIGLFETAYSLKAGAVTFINEHDRKEGRIISVVTESRPKLKTVLNPGSAREAVAYIGVIYYRGSVEDSMPTFQLAIIDGFTVSYDSGLHAVKLVSGERGARFYEVKMGIRLGERDVFNRYEISSRILNDPAVDTLLQVRPLDSFHTIKQSLERGEIEIVLGRTSSGRYGQARDRYYGNYEEQKVHYRSPKQFAGAAIPEGGYISRAGEFLEVIGDKVNYESEDYRAEFYLEMTLRP